MKSALKQLIEQYEIEKTAFEKMLKECLNEEDYLGAHYHSKTLHRIKSELSLLYNLDDPLYDKKSELNKMLLRVEKEPSYMQSFWEGQIKGQKKEIEKLKDQKHELIFDTQEIDDALFDLYEGKNKGFKIYFKVNEDKLYFDFKLTKQNILYISIPTNQELKSSHIFNDYYLKGLKRLGFKINEEEGVIDYQYDMKDFKDAIFIKTLMARIVYNIYTYNSFNKCFLVIKQ